MRKQQTYNEIETRELELYIVNDSRLYTGMITPYIKSLTKKLNKGTYSAEKATKGFYSIAHEGSKQYSKDFSTGRDYLQMFSASDKKEVAKRLEEYYMQDIKDELNKQTKQEPEQEQTTEQTLLAAK